MVTENIQITDSEQEILNFNIELIEILDDSAGVPKEAMKMRIKNNILPAHLTDKI